MGIIVAQKYIWEMQVENASQFLRDEKTGTLLDVRNFGEVFEYFILGGNETLCISSEVHVNFIGKK